ncbi:MAG: GNAT family N-acetyltransferase [Hamadaea sp.]|uniref:GNAT family N-acetyltransferase n=1 Tax=Hamadaea sp. TaxID=2024425 RepID=UPI0017A32587|nr:GNAT family N-acetyltransferase [Hamadaea sp.]NUT23364.1 GNAT family N-acetyltransferase [Hamadaea sp.]
MTEETDVAPEPELETTWDGLPIAPDNPRGSGVVVRRSTPDGPEFLLLHRMHEGPDYEGDWAWTSPSGARHPGEPVLTGALRELAEEAGLEGLDVRPVDLSGGWAVFAAEADAAADVVMVDPEHDRFEWLPREVALARLAPESVADNFRRGSGVPLPRIAFRPLARTDFPTLLGWLGEPHVARWWRHRPENLDSIERKYGPRVDGNSPVRVHVLLVDGVPAGIFQDYRTADYPAYAAAVADSEAIAIDYLIGDPGLVGRGIGPQAIWAYARDVAPAAPRVVASPDETNEASIRALLKAGFRYERDAAVEDRTEAVCVLDRARVFG